MKQLKEKNEKKNQKEIRKENPPPPHPRAREEGIVLVSDLNEIESRPSAYRRGILRTDLKDAANKIGMSAAEVNAWQHYMEEVAWRFTTGTRINYLNFRRSLRMWHKIEDKICEERMQNAAVDNNSEAAKRLERSKLATLGMKAKNDPSLWALCRERCENSDTCGCKRGVTVPPDRQLPRPHRPEECPYFRERIEVA